MDDKVSIVIPAKNEIHLEKTIKMILTAARGDIEIIAVLDGYIPDPQIHIHDKRVTFLHYSKSIGQRAAINAGAKFAKGKYILKTDAHSMFDEGFDVKLKADCEYNWTVIPRMYNLDIEKWEPKWRKYTDFMWIRSPWAKVKPFRHNYWDGKCAREFPKEYQIHKKMDYRKGDICDIMTGQGACFFMHLKRYWELGGCDEAHGSWGQHGVEVALKAWLSGGSLKINKKTWFAHYFRGGSGPSFPYAVCCRDHKRAREYSKNLWMSGKWPQQKRTIEWLVKKFSPLPTWEKIIKNEKVIEKEKGIAQHTQEYAQAQIKGEFKPVKRAVLKKCNRPDSTWIAKGANFAVEELHEHCLSYSQLNKLASLQWLHEVFPEAVSRILAGEIFTKESFQRLDYYHYLVTKLNPVCHKPGYNFARAEKHIWETKACDLMRLCKSVKDNGLMAPLDMYMEGNHPILIRGYRRLEIIHQLGVKHVPVRIWRNEWLAKHFIPTPKWGGVNGIIHKTAINQFRKYKHKSTDKYWVHGYTPFYDVHIGCKTMSKLRILELGVKEGMSLDLWRRSFPKSQIFGIDKDPSAQWNELRHDQIKTFCLDYTNKDLLKKFAEEQGPFDLIIDDGLHRPTPQRETFNLLWGYLRNGGVYVIEDLHPNYSKRHKGNSVMPTLAAKIDHIWTNHKVKGVGFYPNICFVEKA